MTLTDFAKEGKGSSSRRFELVIVEDNPHCRDLFKFVFEQAGFDCRTAESIAEARTILKSRVPDLIILDEGLPDGSGLDLCREIRQEKKFRRVLVSFLTARKSVFNGSEWSKAGGDACWPKTNKYTRLTAAAYALLRRRAWDEESIETRIPGLIIDLERNTVSYQRIPSKNLSPREMRLFRLIANAYPCSCLREEIKEVLFRYGDADTSALALNQIISRLKKKLPANLLPFFQTIHGMGYCLGIPSLDAEKSSV